MRVIRLQSEYINVHCMHFLTKCTWIKTVLENKIVFGVSANNPCTRTPESGNVFTSALVFFSIPCYRLCLQVLLLWDMLTTSIVYSSFASNTMSGCMFEGQWWRFYFAWERERESNSKTLRMCCCVVLLFILHTNVVMAFMFGFLPVKSVYCLGCKCHLTPVFPPATMLWKSVTFCV